MTRRPCDSAAEERASERETLGDSPGFPWLGRSFPSFPGVGFLVSCCCCLRCYCRCSSSSCSPHGVGVVATTRRGSLWTPGRFRPGSMKPSLGFSSTGVFFPCQASAASGFGEVPVCQLCHALSFTSPLLPVPGELATKQCVI